MDNSTSSDYARYFRSRLATIQKQIKDRSVVVAKFPAKIYTRGGSYWIRIPQKVRDRLKLSRWSELIVSIEKKW